MRGLSGVRADAVQSRILHASRRRRPRRQQAPPPPPPPPPPRAPCRLTLVVEQPRLLAPRLGRERAIDDAGAVARGLLYALLDLVDVPPAAARVGIGGGWLMGCAALGRLPHPPFAA